MARKRSPRAPSTVLSRILLQQISCPRWCRLSMTEVAISLEWHSTNRVKAPIQSLMTTCLVATRTVGHEAWTFKLRCNRSPTVGIWSSRTRPHAASPIAGLLVCLQFHSTRYLAQMVGPPSLSRLMYIPTAVRAPFTALQRQFQSHSGPAMTENLPDSNTQIRDVPPASIPATLRVPSVHLPSICALNCDAQTPANQHPRPPVLKPQDQLSLRRTRPNLSGKPPRS